MQVFSSLVYHTRKLPAPKSTKTTDFRNLIKGYLDEYCRLCGYIPLELNYSQQISAYECTKVDTAYKNGIILQLGNKLRMFINLLTRQKERTEARRKALKKQKVSEERIKEIIRNEITLPCTELKLAVASGNIQNLPMNQLTENAIQHLRDFFEVYDPNYRFKNNNIYYDCKANPIAHLKAYYKLNDLCERSGAKPFACFPLRRMHIPCYITIDTLILNNSILEDSQRSHFDKYFIWGKVVDISCRALKAQGESKSLRFRGTIQTDGVGVSILKQNKETSKGGTKNTGIRVQTNENEFPYIDTLSNEELQRTTNKCVFIDPGRRDMLFCMGEKCESRHDGYIYRYTSNQRAEETKSRKFRKLCEQNKPKTVSDAEKSLSKHNSSTVDLQKYAGFLEARRDSNDQLASYYRSDDPRSLPFRKLKLSSYINRKQSDTRLARTLKQKFGQDCVLVLRNWSARHTRYHEPIRGVGMRRMLKKKGLTVYLLDEHKTSSFCPKCQTGELEKFSYVKNPRPFMRGKYPLVKCNGLLRCTNQKCLVPARLWNRDLAAVLNFRDIVFSHREALGRPERFRRQTLKRPSTSVPSSSTHKKIRPMPSDDGSPEEGNIDRVNL